MRKTLFLLPLVLLIAACSSSGTIETYQAKSEAIKPNSVVSLNVMPVTNTSSVERVAEQLRDALYGRLMSRGVFSSIVLPGKPSHYVMDVKLQHADEVSQTARIMAGVFAGSNKLTADVSVKNAHTDTVIANFRVSGESASHPLSSENGMEDAINEVITRIIEALR